MERSQMLYDKFFEKLPFEATPSQEGFFRDAAEFMTTDNGDILIVNGYAGTGKTSAIAAVIDTMTSLNVPCVLMAPTGRSAKVLSSYTGKPAFTIHKIIYRQNSVGEDGFGKFSLAPNRTKNTLFVVDEVSLIGVEQESRTQFGSGNTLEDLIRFVRDGVNDRLIMIGDSAQLPPIGLEKSPALDKDYMSFAGGASFCEMTDVVRQKKESGILWNATLLRKIIRSSDVPSGEEDGRMFSPDDIGLKTKGFDDVIRITGAELTEALSDAYGFYGEDGTMVLCRSNKMANRYNAGIRSQIQYKEERLVRGDKLMVVKNCYQFVQDIKGLDYIANGDICILQRIRHFEERYGLHFADAELSFPDYGDVTVNAKVCLDTLESESASLTYDQQNVLYQGVSEDYSFLTTKKKRYNAVREDPYYNALQLKYAEAITCHKSQGGQWECVFVDNPFWQEELSVDDLKWLYTAVTRATDKLYLVNFPDRYFQKDEREDG
jgi:exodeoxyribonuclease-5